MKKVLSFLFAYVSINIRIWFGMIPMLVLLSLVYPRGAVVLVYSGTRGLEKYAKMQLEEARNG